MTTDATLAARFLKSKATFNESRFLALFSGDTERGARALWGALADDEAAVEGSSFASDEAQQILGAVVTEVSSERALRLFQRLAADPGPLGGRYPYDDKTHPYPGWSVPLETLVRGLPERRALVAGWSSIAAPVGPALGFALARLGEVAGEALGPDALPFFARWAAERYSWCPVGFEDAERAFGEAAWRRAVVQAAALDEVDRVGMWLSHFEPYAPYAGDEALLAIVNKLTWKEPGCERLFFDRGPDMAALLERRADTLLAEGRLFLGPAFTLTAYASELAHRGQPLPERYVSPLKKELRPRYRSGYVDALLEALPSAQRDPLLLAHAESLNLQDWSTDEYPELIRFVTPELTRWAVGVVLRGAENYWLNTNLWRFGPQTVPLLAEAPDPCVLTEHGRNALLHCCSSFPSETAAKLVTELVAGMTSRGLDLSSDQYVTESAVSVLSLQPLEALVREAGAHFAEAPARFAEVLGWRCFEPEVRALAAALVREHPKLAAALAPALDEVQPLPEPVRAFVAEARGLPPDEPLRALYQAVVSGRGQQAAEVATRLAPRHEGARWFYTLYAWGGDPPLLGPLLDAAGPEMVEPMLALWKSPRLRKRIEEDGVEYLLKKLFELAPDVPLRLLRDRAVRPDKQLRRLLLAGLKTVLAGADRGQGIAVLRELLAPQGRDGKRRLLALELASTDAVPELAEELRALAASKPKTNEQALVERALVRVQPPASDLVEPSDAADASAVVVRALGARQLAAAGGEPIVRVQSVGAVFAAATANELHLFAPDGTVRARIAGLAGGATRWEVGPDGAYVAVLEKWGVALYRGDGRRVVLPPEDAEPGEAAPEADDEGTSDDDLEDQLLYPNDGIAGVLPLNATRLLIYAVGHNVYEPLTVYDSRTGVQVGSQKTAGFAVDAAVLPGGEHFVDVTTTGSLELRASEDGRRLQKLGAVALSERDWAQLRLAGRGSVLLHAGTRLSIFSPPEPSARAATTAKESTRRPAARWTSTSLSLDLKQAALVTDAGAEFFAVVSETAAEVFTIGGALKGRMTFASSAPKAPRPVAISGAFLGRAAGGILTVYDLDGLARRGAFTADAEITALASAPEGFLLGLRSGAVLHVGLA